MNKEQPICCVYTSDIYGHKYWKLKNRKLHRTDGPAIEYGDGENIWWVYGECVFTTPLELSVGQSITWYDDLALVVKQINPILFRVLIGNQKKYLFSLANSEYADSRTYPDVSISHI